MSSNGSRRSGWCLPGSSALTGNSTPSWSRRLKFDSSPKARAARASNWSIAICSAWATRRRRYAAWWMRQADGRRFSSLSGNVRLLDLREGEMVDNKILVCCGGLIVTLFAMPAAAEVASLGANGFEVREAADVAAGAGRGYSELAQPGPRGGYRHP